MGKRSTARKLAMQALYQAQVGGQDISDFFQNLVEPQLSASALEFARQLAFQTWENRAQLDAIIEKNSKDWPLQRLAEVDKSILRLALYELNQEKDTPVSVVVNEAVELAKKFSGRESFKFINGILGAFLKT